MERLVPEEVTIDILNNDEVPKPKKSRKKKKPENSVKDIESIIKTIFGILEFTIGPEWKIQDDEAHNIADPLSRILEKYDLISKVGQVSDGFMLITAIGIVVIPRLLITKSKKTQIKKNKDNVVEMRDRIDKERETTKDNSKPNGSSSKGFTDGDIIKALSNTIHI